MCSSSPRDRSKLRGPGRLWLALGALLSGALLSGALLSGALPAAAQNVTLPGSSGQQTCVQVQVTGEKPSPYNCLNQQLAREAQGAGQGTPAAPLGATSQSNQVGTFNEYGVAEQYGKNFGKSAMPYRPAAPVYGGLGGAK